MSSLRLGTRGSQLALWQARAVAARLQEASGTSCEIVVIKTSGDRLAEAPLSEAGGKRLFAKEIEDALLGREIDLAVHSCKDMPVVLPDGLAIGAVLPREDPHDVLVLPAARHAGEVRLETLRQDLGASPRVGTSSVRRIAELRRFLPDARFEPIRGNLDTRLRKLDRGDHDVLVLAAAGLRRLGFTDRISATLPFDVCLPAPGQGAIAVEVRGDDGGTRARVATIEHAPTASQVTAERACVAVLGGGCRTPIGAIAELDGDELDLRAVVASLDGARAVRGRLRGSRETAAETGTRLAEQLIREGALAILEQVRRTQAPVDGLQP
jgi:hydroxymethylbilane synthase